MLGSIYLSNIASIIKLKTGQHVDIYKVAINPGKPEICQSRQNILKKLGI